MSAAAAREAAVAQARAASAGSSRVVFVSGNFNTVHPGHLRLLRFAAECGDFLIVGVNDDRAEGVLLPEALRLESVRAIGFVDHAFTLHGPPEAFIAALQPAVVVKGKEHESKRNPEQAVVDGYGGKLLFGSGDMSFSSLELLKRDILEPTLSTIIAPADYPRRHGFSRADLRGLLARFRGFRVAVVGDLIVDEYIACDALGMSQEDPTIVVTPIQQERFVGGAGIVAAHAASFGAEVDFYTVAGDDHTARFAEEKLAAYGVRAHVFSDESRPTTLKQRFRASGKTLLRVSHLRQHDISQEIARRMSAAVRAKLQRCDLVVFSDFNYGCLPQLLVDELAAACAGHGVPMVADSQSSSQTGDVSRFPDMLLLTPTEREARLAVRDFNAGLVVLAEQLSVKARARNVIITLGAEGLLVHSEQGRGEWLTDRLPAFNRAPKDTAGAGDSFLIACSLAVAVGADIWRSAYLGAIAAACQVGRVGNIPLSVQEVEQELGD